MCVQEREKQKTEGKTCQQSSKEKLLQKIMLKFP